MTAAGHIELSFCIATLNRGPYIGATLESIICQATDQVEIVVLDGGSTDNTGDVVRAWQERFPQLRYCRQETNRGVDQDFARAVELAQGEYCWLFTDDDLLKPGAIATVLSALTNRYSLVIVNAEVRNADFSSVLSARKLPLTADRVYGPEENDRFLADAGDYLTFIGGVVINRQIWNSREKEKYFGSNFVHVGVIFQQPLPEDVLAIAEPLIVIRYGNAMWQARSFEIWMFKWPRLIWSFASYPDSAKLQVCLKEPWRSMRTLALYRAKGAYSKQQYREWLASRLGSWRKRCVAWAIARFPGRIANSMAIAYYKLFGPTSGRAAVLLDLRNSRFYLGPKPALLEKVARETQLDQDSPKSS